MAAALGRIVSSVDYEGEIEFGTLAEPTGIPEPGTLLLLGLGLAGLGWSGGDLSPPSPCAYGRKRRPIFPAFFIDGKNRQAGRHSSG